MFRCDDCGRLFDIEGKCPECDSDRFTVVTQCEKCGKISEDSEEGLCPRCQRRVVDRIDTFIESIPKAEKAYAVSYFMRRLHIW